MDKLGFENVQDPIVTSTSVISGRPFRAPRKYLATMYKIDARKAPESLVKIPAILSRYRESRDEDRGPYRPLTEGPFKYKF